LFSVSLRMPHREKEGNMSPAIRPPLWGNFIAYADQDLLAFGLLIQGGLLVPACYHGVQAIEKYLKALVLSILDPTGTTETPITRPTLKNHGLQTLAKQCNETDTYYNQSDVIANLKRFEEFDQATRYPWVDQKLGNGFSSEDVQIISEMCKQLRTRLPIALDNYKLGIEVRGYFHGDRLKTPPGNQFHSHEAVKALRKVIPSLDDFVRGWDDTPTTLFLSDNTSESYALN
jgi:HEPN domain-containing protein